MNRELLTRALSAMKSSRGFPSGTAFDVMREIETELAKPDPEPVAWIDMVNIEMLRDKDWLLKCYVQNVPGDEKDIPLYAEPPEPNRNNSDQLKEMQKSCWRKHDKNIAQ